nr:lysozyme inhibitor LprI family protein [Bradyrhizobium uaiense]
MLDCGKTEIDKWDARLNAAYQLLLHRESGARRTKLQAEQSRERPGRRLGGLHDLAELRVG